MGRVKIFAGPNGSGHTTLNSQLKGEFNIDNSGKELKLLAQVSPKKNLNIESNHLPIWFEKYVLSNFIQEEKE